MQPRLRVKVQRLIDEYVGAVGSAVIVTRCGDVVFRSTHDDSAEALAAIVQGVPRAKSVAMEPEVLAIPVDRKSCGYAVALGDDHALLVVTDFGIAPATAALRVKNAARHLGRVLAAHDGRSDGGSSGAPAEILAESKPRLA